MFYKCGIVLKSYTYATKIMNSIAFFIVFDLKYIFKMSYLAYNTIAKMGEL